jgi:HD-like signal output (HDOD) protein
MSYFWRRSLASSVVAARFADILLPARRDEVFIAALLADIGVPILAEALPKQYRPIIKQYTPHGSPVTPEEELEAVEATHGQVSAMVLAHWTLPDAVTTAVNLQQSRDPGEGEAGTMARILNASDQLARLLCKTPDPEEVFQVCTEATGFAKIEPVVFLNILPNIESDIEELASVLRIDVIPSNVYAVIAKTVQEKLAQQAPSC